MSKRPEYQRIRRHLAKGGRLQREPLYEAPISLKADAPFIELGPATQQMIWRTPQRDGRFFHAQTCEWLLAKGEFVLEGQTYHLAPESDAFPNVYHAAE